MIFRGYSEMAASEAFQRNYLGASIPDSPAPPTDKPWLRSRLSPASHQFSGDSSNAVLVLNKVSAGYGNKVVVRQANLHVFPGEVVSIIGVNGSGKSTLLRAIAGIAPLFEGDIHFCGKCVDRLPADKRVRMGVRLLVQDHRLFRTLTLADNLLLSAAALDLESGRERLASPSFTADRAVVTSVATMQRMLESTGPKFTDRAAGTYSGGEQARVALAQVEFGNPKLVLLDEPTSGIDGVAAQSLVSVIRNWQERRIPVVIVEHALEFVASISTRILVMAAGQLHQVDSPIHDSAQLMEEILARS
jgi:ABC-type branched-subunit amino acid transport system ATPase component